MKMLRTKDGFTVACNMFVRISILVYFTFKIENAQKETITEIFFSEKVYKT